jgi:hypothetical protein
MRERGKKKNGRKGKVSVNIFPGDCTVLLAFIRSRMRARTLFACSVGALQGPVHAGIVFTGVLSLSAAASYCRAYQRSTNVSRKSSRRVRECE